MQTQSEHSQMLENKSQERLEDGGKQATAKAAEEAHSRAVDILKAEANQAQTYSRLMNGLNRRTHTKDKKAPCRANTTAKVC